ncbi:MAG: hypothetical protein AAF688_15525 [Bacteroidota bacterium]
MKKIVLVFVFVPIMTSLMAQDETNFFQSQILGINKDAAPLQLSLDAYPFLFLSNGGGGSMGIEFKNWQIGAIGFSVVPPDFIKNTFFENADDISIRRNNAVELFANYYLRKDRKGIYAGILGGPEWFMLEDNISGSRETIIKNYVVSKLGLRVFPFKEIFYLDASFGWSFNLSGTDTKSLGQTSYNASAGGFIYFLQIGARFNLKKQQK